MEASQKIVFEFDKEQSKEFLETLKALSLAFVENKRTEYKDDALLDINQASEVVNLAKQTIYQLVSSGSIPFMKKRKKLYFKKIDLLLWISNGQKMTNEMLTK